MQKNIFWSWFLIVMGVFLFASAGYAYAATPTVWVVDSLTRVQPTDAVGTSTTAAIKVARNEYEAFQIIIRAPASQSLSNVNVTASDLIGPGVISKNNITLYREHYIQVTTPSPSSPYPAGWWPDALIPFVNPETGQPLSGGQLPAAPFPVPAGQNQPVFVDVFIPKDTPAGIYQGQLMVTADGAASITVPLTVTVWNFILPTRPALRTNFGNFRSSQFAAMFGTTKYTARHNALMDKFEHELLRHRLSPSRPSGTEPSFNSATGVIDASSVQSRMTHFINLGLTGYDLPLFNDWPWADPFGADSAKAKQYLTGIHDWLAANGWLWLAYHDGIDEPRGVSGYQAVRDEAADWHGLDSRTKILITEQTKPGDTTWGTLYGSVDIWAPYYSRFDPITWAERRALGEQSWMYGAWGAEGEPGDLLDRPIYEIRVPAWAGFQYGITGLLKWNTVYWNNVGDPWINSATYTLSGDVFNGDGVFFYPGTKVGYDGPIASLRLKTFRDAADDYDYLTLLAAEDPSSASVVAQQVGTTFTNWVKDRTIGPATLIATREEVANRILQLSVGDIVLPVVSLTTPASGAIVSGVSVIVSANASDNIGVVGIQFKLDGTNLGAEDTISPYSVSWNTTTVANGSHILTAVARDAAGNATTSAAVSVTVNNFDTVSPSIPTGLTASAVSSSQINLSWTASTDNIGVAGYKVYRGGMQIATATAVSYADTGLAAATTYIYTVAAYDAAGNTSFQSSSASATTQPASTQKFQIGDRVKTTASVNARSKPQLKGGSKLLGTQPVGALGTVIGGPSTGSGYAWWNINYDNPPDGWSVQNYLEKVAAASAFFPAVMAESAPVLTAEERTRRIAEIKSQIHLLQLQLASLLDALRR